MLGLVTVIGMAAEAVAETTSTLDANKFKAATSISSALDWSTEGNWDGGVPNSADAFAKIQGSGTASGVYAYITSGVPVTVSRIGYDGAPSTQYRSVFVSDKALTIAAANKNNTGMFLYAPVEISAVSPYTRYIQFCGPVTFADGSRILGNYFTTEFRFDRWANGPDAVRTNPCGTNGALYLSGATFSFTAPEGSADDVVGNYRLTYGSPYIVRASGSRHAISAGTTVTGAGIVPGSFVKRVFPDDTIELSVPAAETIPSAALTFAAFTPTVHQEFAMFTQNGTDGITLKFNKYRPEDDFVVGTTNFNWAAKGKVTVSTDADFVPGVFSTAPFNTSATCSSRLCLGTCELQLNPEFGSLAANDYAHYDQLGAEARTGLAVAKGNTFTVNNFTNFIGTVVKRGEGRLNVHFTVRGGGSVEVAGGVFAPTFGEGVELGSLSVAAGAEFVVPEGGLSLDAASLEPGAILSGGTLTVTGDRCPVGVVLKDGARLVYAYDPQGGEVVRSVPLLDKAGILARVTPKFWVDAMDDASLVTVTNGDVVSVSRVNDVRGAGHPYALPASGGTYLPVLKTFGRGRQLPGCRTIAFKGCYVGDNDITKTDSMVWSEALTVRHVFQVLDRNDSYGGQYLGNTSTGLALSGVDASGAHPGDFVRAPSSATPDAAAKTAIIHSSSCAGVLNGVFRVLDKPWDITKGFAYITEYAATLKSNASQYPGGYLFAPLVTSLETVSFNDGTSDRYPTANTFDSDAKSTSRYGNKGLCELLVFDAEVSDLDRQIITAYLAKKWNDCEIVNFSPVNADGSTLGTADLTDGDLALDVASGSLLLDGVTGEGALVKSGEGTLLVRNYDNAGGVLRVTGGTVEIAAPADTADELPEGAFLHLDATDPDSYTTDQYGITEWRDVRGEGYPKVKAYKASSTHKAVVRENALAGLPVADFGAFTYKGGTAVPSLELVRPDGTTGMTGGVRSVFAIWGSRNGGGSGIAGSGGDYNQGRGLVRGTSASTTEAALKFGGLVGDPILRSATSYQYPGFGGSFENAYRFRLNGKAVDPTTTGFSGTFDLVSLVSYEGFGLTCLSGGGLNDHQYSGGEEIGEYIVYLRALSEENAAKVERYLNKKWFGAAAFGPVAGTVEVARGATLALAGGAPLTVSSLSGAGTISGSVVSAANATFVATVDDDGSVPMLAVGKDVDLSAGCTIRFAGSVDKLEAGEYVILRTAGTLSVGTIQIDTTGVRKSRICGWKVQGGDLILTVGKMGLCVIVR